MDGGEDGVPGPGSAEDAARLHGSRRLFHVITSHLCVPLCCPGMSIHQLKQPFQLHLPALRPAVRSCYFPCSPEVDERST